MLIDAGDFLDFSIECAGTPEDRLGGSHRFRVAASLGGRPFEAFPLDVGLRRGPDPGAETLIVPNLLAFAGVEPVSVPTIPLELQAAEKLHAYTRTYGGSRSSTRAKDLVDLALIAGFSPRTRRRSAARSRRPSPTAVPTPSLRPSPYRQRTGARRFVDWPSRGSVKQGIRGPRGR